MFIQQPNNILPSRQALDKAIEILSLTSGKSAIPLPTRRCYFPLKGRHDWRAQTR